MFLSYSFVSFLSPLLRWELQSYRHCSTCVSLFLFSALCVLGFVVFPHIVVASVFAMLLCIMHRAPLFLAFSLNSVLLLPFYRFCFSVRSYFCVLSQSVFSLIALFVKISTYCLHLCRFAGLLSPCCHWLYEDEEHMLGEFRMNRGVDGHVWLLCAALYT